MTKEEAIKILKGDFSKITLGENESHSDVFSKAFDMAIAALEKQIPKKPISKYKYRYGKTVCPACETENTCRIVMFWEKYCPDCGQAIDWSEEE